MAKRQPDAERPRYVLYFRGHRPPDVYPRIWVPIYWDPAEAHAHILRFLGSAEYARDGNVLRIADSNLTITCEQLDDVLDATPSSVTDEVARHCLRFKLGSWEEDHSKKDEPAPVDDGDPSSDQPKLTKQPKPVKPAKAKIPDGWVTIGDWAKKWNITPMEARAALRGSGLTKPEFGWAFDPKDEKKIKKVCGVKS